MTASQNRAQARQNLAGKWKKAVLLTLVSSIITYVINLILNLLPIGGFIIDSIISIPIFFGILISFFKINDNEEFDYLDFLGNGMENFGKVWSIILNAFLKMIVPIILTIACIILLAWSTYAENELLSLICLIIYIVLAIWVLIKGLSYALSLYIIYDNPEMTGKEAVEKSAELMNGNIWSYICLNLSFIGWAILGIFTFGIGYLWLAPYIKISHINFYRNLAGTIQTENDDVDQGPISQYNQ